MAVFVRPFRWHLVGLVALTGLLSAIAMLPPLLTRAVINNVIEQGHRDQLFGLGVALLGCAVAGNSCAYLQMLGMAYVGQTFVMRVRAAVYRHMLGLGMGYFSRTSTGKLVNRLMGDSNALQQILSVASVQVVSDLVCAGFAITATIFINWRLAIPLFALLALFIVNYRLQIGGLKRLTRSQRGAEDRVAAGVQNRLAANLTVKTHGAERRENTVFRGQSAFALELSREVQVASAGFSLNTMLLRDAGRIAIYFLGCAMVLHGTASYGDVTAFSAYAVQLLVPAVRFSQLAQQIESVRISAERLFEILDEAPQVAERPGARDPGRIEGRVDFDRVSFAYEPGRPVLRDFDLHVRPGETVALVGPTGCGKSTVLALLMRLYDAQDGRVRLDGIDVRDFTLPALRRQFGIVLQESMLFSVSLADNIRYGRPSASRAEVEAAARVAEIHDEIASLPGGYDALVGSREVQLSVGQKQRLAIARAVLADPAILVMDEATSALDSQSERAIQLAMERFLRNRTAFVVAHRLSTVRKADRILLLDAGRIFESGCHDDLMALPDGRYRRLYETYSGKGTLFGVET
jgi:subfamily B ATP-binding cassette protein MsbA